jgi:short-subunit dehydrogenase
MGTGRKVAVITGASQGIGAALVKAYRERNYRVVATARTVMGTWSLARQKPDQSLK